MLAFTNTALNTWSFHCESYIILSVGVETSMNYIADFELMDINLLCLLITAAVSFGSYVRLVISSSVVQKLATNWLIIFLVQINPISKFRGFVNVTKELNFQLILLQEIWHD